MALRRGFDWYRIKFLESTGNLKGLLLKAHNRQISSNLAREIKACLQQGRSFFEIAEVSPLEIKPLQLFYGMVGFGRALSMSKSLNRLDTLPQSHGLKDCSQPRSFLENHQLEFQKTGTFQAMNDNTNSLENAFYHDDSKKNIVKVQKCASRDLEGKIINLREILARTLDLGNLFEDTLNEKQKKFACSHFSKNSLDTVFSFTIYYFPIKKERATLKEHVQSLRDSFPFLKSWRIYSASWHGPDTTFTFIASSPKGIDEFSEENLWEDTAGFDAANLGNNVVPQTKPPGNLNPISGSLHANTCIIKPFKDLHLSELSLYYLGMFILSSVVRYRPNIWSNAISGRPGSNGSVDDKCLAVIEKFLTLSETRFPTMIEQAFEKIQNKN